MSSPMHTTQNDDQDWLQVDAGDIDAFIAETSVSTELSEWPLANAVEQNVLVYNGDHVRQAALNSNDKAKLMREWALALSTGPGIVAIKNAMPEHDVIDSANELFDKIINQQRESGGGQGDHFAKPGANDRVWNSLEKHCVLDPASFARYYMNDTIAMISTAWLGRGYQVTAQVNRVNPGGNAQSAHRDYHLGFMSGEQAVLFPQHVHLFCPMLTLQGAVAHCDMPLESGPTLYLPYSQLHKQGYIAFTREDYQQYFNEHRMQLALNKGDMVFFNPALMHAAGANQSSNIYRLANLLQVSSAFGRSIETVDRTGMVQALYPQLLALKSSGSITDGQLHNLIAATAEGYAFPTNLDIDLPSDGLAPPSQADLVLQCLHDALPSAEFTNLLIEQAQRKTSVASAHKPV